MRTRISKDYFYSTLFIACISVPILNIYELTFLVWIFALLATTNFSYSYKLIKLLLPFAAILLIGLYSSFEHQYTIYNIVRDVTYLLKPIIGLILGYQLLQKNAKNVWPTIINAALFIAFCHIVLVAITFISFTAITVNDLRKYCGYFSDFEVYSIIILLFSKQFKLDYSTQKIRLYLGILALSSLFYLSRTNFIQFFILFIAMKGALVINKRSLTIIVSFLLVAGLFYAGVYASNPRRSGKGIEAFLYKIKIAPIEPFKTKIDQDDWKEFNDNYRSYENITTFRQVKGSDALIAGKGVGSTVDLGREMWSNDSEFIRYIPILHNAFATVLLKSGLLGVFCLLWFAYQLSIKYKIPDQQVQVINRLFAGTALFLLFSNWVFMGLYLKLDNKSILIGYLLSYRELYIKQYKLHQKIE